MPFIFLLLFALVCLQTKWEPVSWPEPAGCAILVGTIVLTSWLVAGVIAKALSWQMARHPEQRSALLRRYARCRRWHFIGLLFAYLVSLYLLGWGNVLSDFWKEWTPTFLYSEGNLPGFQVGLLSPFFAGLILSWERFYKVEKVAYEIVHVPDRFLSKAAYLLMQVRHQFFLVLPPIVVMLFLQFLSALVPDQPGELPAVIMLSIMALALILMPILLRLFLGLKPLPPGPLRERLEATARRLNFRFSNVLVWHTRHLLANALVTGFVPWIRYIVLTDRLIDELTPDEIEAVFGHEVGHIKHHHLLFYLAFFATSFILLGFFWENLKTWITQDEIKSRLEELPYVGAEIWELLRSYNSFGKLALLAAYTLLCFGFISRRCERQADLYGSHAVSTDVFINALEKVAAINGIPRDRAGNWLLSWQHPTIAQRVEFLEAMRDNPARIPQFERSIAMLKWAFFLALGVLLWCFPVARIYEFLAQF